MPKLFEYMGIIVLFYSNEHEPVHVHGKYERKESKAELIIKNGVIVDIIYSSVRGRRPLDGPQLADFKALVEHYAQEIVNKWVEYFVLHKKVEPRHISRRIK